MNELSKKKISRTALHNHCEKIEKRINGLFEDFRATDVVTLNGFKMNYENQVKKIEDVDKEILNLLTEDAHVEKEVTDTLERNDKFYIMLSKINDCLEKYSVKEVNPRRLSLSQQLASVIAPPVRYRVKLPKIELQKFDGNIVNWQTFWDQYNSSVHSQETLSAIDKFSYLKGLLCTQASECISGLALTTENYEEAIVLLTERFGNKQLLINAHMDSFVKLPRVRSMNHVKDLRTLYDQLETTVRNLKSLNV